MLGREPKVASVGRRRVITTAVALAAAAADLGVKAGAGSAPEHARPVGIVVLSASIAVALVAIVPRLPSLAGATAAGLGAGGALGNALSAALFGAVPDPIVAHAIAFNVADVFAFVGAAGMVSATALYAVRHPGALRRQL
jgi:lipoprotein signal peptidase